MVLSDTDPKAGGTLREALSIRGFEILLVGKDGGVKLRSPAPVSTRDLFALIDAMPMRQREMRENAD